MKIGYKGLTKDMETTACPVNKKTIYQLGVIYEKQSLDRPPVLCSSDGYHYCNELTDVFQFYSNNGSNRFFKIEVLGDFKDGHNKSNTTSFRILEELDSQSMKDIIEQEKQNKSLKLIKSNLNLDLIKKLQVCYPQFIIAGSVALFLHGVRLGRWHDDQSDIDLISPYYILPETKTGKFKILESNIKPSGNDFDECFTIEHQSNFAIVDYKIDPKCKYEFIEFEGFMYKVCPILDVMNAKMKYALNGQKKHQSDLKEMIKTIK
jgi:hypothetical protein